MRWFVGWLNLGAGAGAEMNDEEIASVAGEREEDGDDDSSGSSSDLYYHSPDFVPQSLSEYFHPHPERDLKELEEDRQIRQSFPKMLEEKLYDPGYVWRDIMLYLGYRVIGRVEEELRREFIYWLGMWDRTVGRGFARVGGGEEEEEEKDRAKDMNIIRCYTRCP